MLKFTFKTTLDIYPLRYIVDYIFFVHICGNAKISYWQEAGVFHKQPFWHSILKGVPGVPHFNNKKLTYDKDH